VLVFAGLLLTAGSLGDRHGRRLALQAGLVVFGLASVVSAFVDTPGQLIASRAVMGVGGALIMPATLSIISNVFTDPKERGRAIGVWAGVSALGVAIGPVAGGWLLEHFWWGSVFLVNVPIVVVALVAGRLLVPESRDPNRSEPDVPGALLSIAALVTLVWAIIEAPERGWTDSLVLAAFVLAAALAVAFLLWERRTAHPMLPLEFFRNPRFSAASASITLVFFAFFGSLFILTQYLQFVMGYTPLEAGIRTTPFALVMMVAAPSSARIVERVGTKRVVTVGLVIAAVGLTVAASCTTGTGYGRVLLSMVVMASGMGLTMAPATESIMGSLPLHRAGVGSAVNDTTRQVGGALGVAVLGSLLASRYGPVLDEFLDGRPVPPDAAEQIERSVGGAIAVAQRVGGPIGDVLRSTAREAFVEGMQTAVLAGAGVALAGAVVAFLFLPARAPVQKPADPTEEPQLDLSA
jgi:EmrB/QacA subfamily drug resistance transporter